MYYKFIKILGKEIVFLYINIMYIFIKIVLKYFIERINYLN